MSRVEQHAPRWPVYFLVMVVAVGIFVFGYGVQTSKDVEMGVVVFPSVVERVRICLETHGLDEEFDACFGGVYGLRVVGPAGEERIANSAAYYRKQACRIALAECWSGTIIVSRPSGWQRYTVEVVDGSRIL